MSEPAEKTEKVYLDYLDKEMSIMGILSAFCVAVGALVLERVASAKEGGLAAVWEFGYQFIVIGSGLMLLAALFFYRQRSLLAWFYGQMSLCLAESSEGMAGWLKEADSWATWIHYRIAFGCLMVAFIEYGLGLLSSKYPGFRSYQYVYALLPVWAGVIVLVPWCWILAKYRYRYEDDPVRKFLTVHGVLKEESQETVSKKRSSSTRPAKQP